MQIGKMNTKITIQRETIDRNDYGEEIKTWDDVHIVYAKQRQLTGSEKYITSQELSISRTEFYIRYIPRISVKDRIKITEIYKGITIGDIYYKIESIANVDGKNVELKILCSRIEN